MMSMLLFSSSMKYVKSCLSSFLAPTGLAFGLTILLPLLDCLICGKLRRPANASRFFFVGGPLEEQPSTSVLRHLLFIEIAHESLTDVETLLINSLQYSLVLWNRHFLYDSCPHSTELNASLRYQSFLHPAFKTAGTTAHQLGGAG